MIRLRKSKKTEEGISPASSTQSVLAPIHRKAADCLNRKTANWSTGRKKNMLLLFCLVMGNISLFIAGQAILSATGPPGIKLQRLVKPMVMPMPGTFKPIVADSNSKQIFNQKKQHDETDK